MQKKKNSVKLWIFANLYFLNCDSFFCWKCKICDDLYFHVDLDAYFIAYVSSSCLRLITLHTVTVLLCPFHWSGQMASGRMWLQIGMSGWLTGDYSLRCQPVDYSDRPEVLRVGDIMWLTKLFHLLYFIYVILLHSMILSFLRSAGQFTFL